MEYEELKAAVKELSVQDRRKLALYILDLEREHVTKTIGPQLEEDLNDVSKVVREALEKLKGMVNKKQ